MEFGGRGRGAARERGSKAVRVGVSRMCLAVIDHATPATRSVRGTERGRGRERAFSKKGWWRRPGVAVRTLLGSWGLKRLEPRGGGVGWFVVRP